MKTLTFKNGMLVVTEDGMMPYMERVGTSLSAEEVDAILKKHNFKDKDVQSSDQRQPV